MNTTSSNNQNFMQKTNPKQKAFIKTYGCQMNVYDSQRMSDSLNASGYEMTDNIDEADLVLMNTCHIREKAAEKLYSDLGRLRVKRLARKNNRKLTIGVTGCVAQAEGEEIFRRSPIVDLIIGPQTYHRLPEILQNVKNGQKVIDIEHAAEDKFKFLPKALEKKVAKRGVSAFLTIQEGCDKFCTFCVVPYTRGAEISRSYQQIEDEAKYLVDMGVREITLLGQNVNAWKNEENGKKIDLGDLLFRLAKIDDLERLRYTTSHPRDMTDSLIYAHRDLPQLMPYLHLPVQSGSDKILKAMNRQHSAKDYLRLIEKIRSICPDIAFSGDFIVGFPGEENQDFQDTLDLVNEVFYSSAYSFKYSPRPGTPGAKIKEQVKEDIKTQRLQKLQNLLTKQQNDFLKSKIGQKMNILLERPGRDEGQFIGRSPWLFPVVVSTKNNIGDIITVEITANGTNSLLAEQII